MRNIAIFLAVLLPFFSGCATIATSLLDSATDSIICHHKCPGGSPEAERKCSDQCKRELAAEREKNRHAGEEFEWEQKVDRQMDAVTKNYRGPLK